MSINAQIERAKQELEQMIDLNPDAMLLVSDTGKVLRANRALLSLIGAGNFEAVLDSNLDTLFGVPEIADDLLAAGGGYRVLTIKCEVTNAPQCPLQFTVVGDVTETGMATVLVRDMSDENERNAQIEKQHKKEAVTALAGALMHNLNQSLTVILMQAQMTQLGLQKGATSPAEMLSSLQQIISHTTKVAETIRSLSDATDYEVEPYLEGVKILDIKKSVKPAHKHSTRVSSTLPGSVTSSTQSTTKLLISLLEAHEPDAAGHAGRTSRYAGGLGLQLGLPQDELDILQKGAFLHDIGKLGISDIILRKTTSLDRDEMIAMQGHPRIGRDLLVGLGFPEEVVEIVYNHHERYDGMGYPRGKAGDDISHLARIVAVADTFDVMNAGRQYSPAVSFAVAAHEINSESGSQFDPVVVEALGKCRAQFERRDTEDDS